MKLLVIDAQGGGLGKQIISLLKKENADIEITAVGTNSTATAAMLKAGADKAATGENSVCVCVKKADVIVGPIGIVLADSMLGEITEKMAAAVARSEARKILIPYNNCETFVVGVEESSVGKLAACAVSKILE